MSVIDRADQLELGSLIRKCRKQRGLTLQALCDRAGLSPGYLSQVERAMATPSLGTLAQIAHALDLGLDYFVSCPKPADAVTRADHRATFQVSDSGVSYETLSAGFPGHELSSYIIHSPPGYESETFQHEGEEFVYILSGLVEHSLGGESFLLRPGDSLHFKGSTPHSWKTVGDKAARMLWTGTLAVLQNRRKDVLPGRQF